MADFYSLVYMNAIGEDPISADFKDGNACHDKCTGANELCLAMLDVDKKPVGQCTCTDNAIRDENGDCIVEIAATELVIDNCPTDTHRSPPKCAESVDFNKVPLQVSLNGTNRVSSGISLIYFRRPVAHKRFHSGSKCT